VKEKRLSAGDKRKKRNELLPLKHPLPHPLRRPYLLACNLLPVHLLHKAQ
jgi:hypothetical protein